MRDLLPPELAASRIKSINTVIITAKPTENEDERNGINFQHSYYPIFDQKGEVSHVATYSSDITERKAIEQQKNEIYKREHHISQILQEAIIPPVIPHTIGKLSIAAKYLPALNEAEIGGDFYDIFELGKNKLGVLIGDVAGKGLQAAIRVATARYAIRSYAYIQPSPGKVMALANDLLCKESPDMENLLTAFFAVIDSSNGEMTYVSAGHEPPVICDGTGIVEELSVTGIMLGIYQGAKYVECNQTLKNGENVVLFTDGITEARKEDSILFEKKGIMEHLNKLCDTSPESIAESLLEAASEHAGGKLQDDVAIVVLGFNKDG